MRMYPVAAGQAIAVVMIVSAIVIISSKPLPMQHTWLPLRPSSADHQVEQHLPTSQVEV